MRYEVTLYIDSIGGQQTVSLENEISIGRTDLAHIALNDPTLSRLHVTIFREGEDVWLLDENSSNGCFVNGERVSVERKLRNGDEILLGSNTRIYVEINQPAFYTRSGTAAAANAAAAAGGKTESKGTVTAPTGNPAASTNLAVKPKTSIPLIPLIGAAMTFLIVVFALTAFLAIRYYNPDGENGNQGNTGPIAKINPGLLIPVRVMDPLGGEDPDDLDDFLASWEGEEDPLKAEDIEQLNVSSDPSSPDATGQPRVDLNVSPEFWKQQINKSLSRGTGRPTISTPQMSGGGFSKQLAKGAELRDRGYKVPLDFADLAELRLKGVLVEMPIATESYVLDVGGSAGGEEFSQFDFNTGSTPIQPGSEKYSYLKRLADNFEGRKYDLNNANDRKHMRMRLLRMFNANSKKLFEQICAAYYAKFKVPLRVTSLMRSMDYQKKLNSVNGNSYNVRPGTVPPHTTGNTFDVGRNHLPTDAQNFLIETLSGFEVQGRLDTLIEGNVNACFHTFIFPDGSGPSGTTTTTAAVSKPPVNQPSPKPKPKTGK